jgi:hypothetical protein
MTNFTIVAFQDVYELACSLRSRVSLFKGEAPSVIQIRGPRANADDPDDDLSFVRYKDGAKWQELINTLTRLKRLGDQMLGGIEFGRIFIERIDSGVTINFAQRTGGYVERFTRLYVALRTNPATIHHSGAEGWHLQVGQIVAVNQRVPCAALNLGDHWSAALVVDFRKRDAAEDRLVQ